MARHNELGREGEKLAEDWLVRHGFTILYRNWRYARFEVDIIALKNNIPHFVEVKLRSSKDFGFPEESVSRKKIRSLFQAVDEFMFHHPIYNDFRLDILSINQTKGTDNFFFIEDVYL